MAFMYSYLRKYESVLDLGKREMVLKKCGLMLKSK